MKFIQKRRFYVRLCYDMLFFLTKYQLLNQLITLFQRTDRG